MSHILSGINDDQLTADIARIAKQDNEARSKELLSKWNSKPSDVQIAQELVLNRRIDLVSRKDVQEARRAKEMEKITREEEHLAKIARDWEEKSDQQIADIQAQGYNV